MKHITMLLVGALTFSTAGAAGAGVGVVVSDLVSGFDGAVWDHRPLQ